MSAIQKNVIQKSTLFLNLLGVTNSDLLWASKNKIMRYWCLSINAICVRVFFVVFIACLRMMFRKSWYYGHKRLNIGPWLQKFLKYTARELWIWTTKKETIIFYLIIYILQQKGWVTKKIRVSVWKTQTFLKFT